jgi:hypothetical protein
MRGDMRDMRGDMRDVRGDMRGDMRDSIDVENYENIPQPPNTTPEIKPVGYSLNNMTDDNKNELRDKLYKLSETENYRLANGENKSGSNVYLIVGVVCFLLFGYFFYIKKIKK